MSSIDQLIARLGQRLEAGRDEPVSRRIAEDVWLGVVEGVLDSGARLPTARQLAIALGVSPRSVELAYDELERRGVVATRGGEGTFISLKPPPEEERRRHQQFAELCGETVRKARELGFSVDDLMDAVAEYRSVERGAPE